MKYSISVQRKPFVFITYVKCTYTGEIIFVCVRRLVRSRRCSAHRRLSIDSRRVSVRLFDSTGNRERKRGKNQISSLYWIFICIPCLHIYVTSKGILGGLLVNVECIWLFEFCLYCFSSTDFFCIIKKKERP